MGARNSRPLRQPWRRHLSSLLAEAKNWGLVHWARPILNVLFDGNADTTCYEVDQILGPLPSGRLFDALKDAGV
jgi:hypothetical protein